MSGGEDSGLIARALAQEPNSAVALTKTHEDFDIINHIEYMDLVKDLCSKQADMLAYFDDLNMAARYCNLASFEKW